MTDRSAKSKLFFGWLTVIASGIIGFFGIGFAGYGFSVLFKPIAADLMLNRAMTSAAASVQNLGSGLGSPLGGWASDKYGSKWVIIAGIITLVIGCLLMYFVSSLWGLLVVWGLLIGFGFAFGFSIILDRAIVDWFVNKSGIALNLKFGIQSLSALILLPVLAWMISALGWRTTCAVFGVVIALVCFPLAWFYIKSHKPEYYGLLPDGREQKDTTVTKKAGKTTAAYKPGNAPSELSFGQTSRTLGFWMFIGVIAVSGLANPIMGVHSVPFLTDMGTDPVKAAGMMSIWITVSIPARMLAGFLVDRMKIERMRWLIVIGYLLQALSVTAYLIGRNESTIYAWFVLYGIGQGMASGAFIPIMATYYGRLHFGSIIGTMVLINLPVMLAAPIYVGWVYDTTSSYITVFGLMALLLTVSALIAGFIRPPRQSLRTT